MHKVFWSMIGVVLVTVAVSGAPAYAPYGDYPNCVAPAVPLEQHGWWKQDGDAVPRHIHIGACMPNARDTTGSLVSVSGVQPFSVRVVSFNNPDSMNFVRWSWESSVKQKVSGTWDCAGDHGDHHECIWIVPMTLDTLITSNGLHELRLTENISVNSFGRRHFGTLNFQIYVKNGDAPGSNYRSVPDPIARSWYNDVEYTNVRVNYMSLFAGGVGGAQLDRSVPLVKGVVPLKIKHSEASSNPVSELWVDANFHAHPEDWTEAAVGVPQPLSGATLLYRRAEAFSGTYNLDTRTLKNGRHSLYFQTSESVASGVHSSALKVFIDVAN